MIEHSKLVTLLANALTISLISICLLWFCVAFENAHIYGTLFGHRNQPQHHRHRFPVSSTMFMRVQTGKERHHRKLASKSVTERMFSQWSAV